MRYIRVTVFGLLVVDGGDRTDLIHIGPKFVGFHFKVQKNKSLLYIDL